MKEDDFYIEQFLGGEEKAFEAIVRKYQNRVLNIFFDWSKQGKRRYFSRGVRVGPKAMRVNAVGREEKRRPEFVFLRRIRNISPAGRSALPVVLRMGRTSRNNNQTEGLWKKQNPDLKTSGFLIWCRRRESNPHGRKPNGF